jgi:hypothetical protein
MLTEAEKIAFQVKTIYANEEEAPREKDSESDISIDDLLERAESINYQKDDPAKINPHFTLQHKESI